MATIRKLFGRWLFTDSQLEAPAGSREQLSSAYLFVFFSLQAEW